MLCITHAPVNTKPVENKNQVQNVRFANPMCTLNSAHDLPERFPLQDNWGSSLMNDLRPGMNAKRLIKLMGQIIAGVRNSQAYCNGRDIAVSAAVASGFGHAVEALTALRRIP
jgi:hypothetical protein